MMTYSWPLNHFCGLCIMRLRGWSATKLVSNGPGNKKP
jgi:hypothetical protein